MFIFVVKPLGTCRGWGSSRSVALLSAPPEAQCAAPGGPHPVAPHGAGGRRGGDWSPAGVGFPSKQLDEGFVWSSSVLFERG
ncbi:unnamed protein product [Pleuronectes platessa]|uniref:Uncharacterized protein n=1 Tax=Pleuronectes platessa TaxID=8262 RepID=A0A9N7TRW5_PLEPL|nr:unnamed protein product [Pleuronectes platessa]